MVQIEINLVAVYASLVDENNKEIPELGRLHVKLPGVEIGEQKTTLVWHAPAGMARHIISGMLFFVHRKAWTLQKLAHHTLIEGGETLEVEIHFMDGLAERLAKEHPWP